MRDAPSATDIIDEVEKALREGLPQGFYQRVAANGLALALREQALADGFESAERNRLEALLGKSGDVESLNAELCQQIQDGKIAFDDASLIAHLHATTREKMLIDQPRYAAFKARGTD